MSERTVNLPPSHWEVLEAEAAFMDISVEAALAQAIRLYQCTNANARLGKRVEFVQPNFG